MNNNLRNLTLTAAALAALTVTAPKAAADDHDRGGDRRNAPRQEYRAPQRREEPRQEFRNDRREWRERGAGGYGRAYVAPVRPYARYAYAAPYRVFSGVRFFAACPGPGFVHIMNFGWVLPPWFGAVWVPGHYDIGGYWVDGFWQ